MMGYSKEKIKDICERGGYYIILYGRRHMHVLRQKQKQLFKLLLLVTHGHVEITRIKLKKIMKN